LPELQPVYDQLYTSDKRYFVLTGGRGSGKTFVIQDYLVRLMQQKGQGILYTRYTMTSAEKTIIPLFTKYIEKIHDINLYNITKEKITYLPNGSFVLFSGIKTSSGDQTGNLKSLPNITTWVIEEGEDYNKKDSFRDIDDSIRDKLLQNRVIWIQNPSHIDHFFFQRFFEETHEKVIHKDHGYVYIRCTHPDVEHIHTTYLDNLENLDPKKVEQWENEKVKNLSLYEHKYLGGWLEDMEGQLFTNLKHYKKGDLRLEDVEFKATCADIADKGMDFLCILVGYIVGNKVYIDDVIMDNSESSITQPRSVAFYEKHKAEFNWIESNNSGNTYANYVKRDCKNVAFKTFNAVGNKETRIISNEAIITDHFVFRSDYEIGSDYHIFMKQIKSFNKDEKLNGHDDAPDATASLARILNRSFPHLFTRS